MRRPLPHWRADAAAYFVTWRLHSRQSLLGPEDREFVFAILKRFDRWHWDLHAAVVMDDHVHAVVTPAPGRLLEVVVQAWKARSALGLRERGRIGPFWQRGYYDRIIRSETDLIEKIRYVANNPRRRWPEVIDYPWLLARCNEQIEADWDG